MRAGSHVKAEEQSDESPSVSSVLSSDAVSAGPVCLADIAEPWLRDHYYRTGLIRQMRLTLSVMCAMTGHRQCAKSVWQDGLAQGADREAWDGTAPSEDYDGKE